MRRGLEVGHHRWEDKEGPVHPDVRHGIVSPAPAVLQLDAGHTHRRAACGSGDPRNALLFGQARAWPG